MKTRFVGFKAFGIRLCGRVAAAGCACCAGFVLAQETRTVQAADGAAYRFVVSLTDGSRLVGTPSIGAIPVQTDFAKLNIDVEHVSMATRGGEGEFIFLFKNGDRLQGEIVLRAFGLKTIFGDVTLETKRMESLVVRRQEQALALVEDGLVAYFPFDGNLDNAVGEAVLAATGQVEGFAPGVMGLAREFRKADGGDSLSLPDIRTGGESSICFWVRIEKPDTHNSLVSINPGNMWQTADLWLFTSHGRIALIQARKDFRYRFGPASALSEAFEASPQIKPNTFYHVAYTFKEGDARFYLDGRLYARYENVSPLPAETRPVDIGLCRLSSGSLYPLAGKMDDLRFYSRALSETEIQVLREAGR